MVTSQNKERKEDEITYLEGRLPVSLERVALSESFSANCARIRTLARVNQIVTPKLELKLTEHFSHSCKVTTL